MRCQIQKKPSQAGLYRATAMLHTDPRVTPVPTQYHAFAQILHDFIAIYRTEFTDKRRFAPSKTQ